MKFLIVFACILCAFAAVSDAAALPVGGEETSVPETHIGHIEADEDVARADEDVARADVSDVATDDVAEDPTAADSSVVRTKRATCDVLSFNVKGFSVNHAACATHCLIKGFKGGHCNGNAVCVCRH